MALRILLRVIGVVQLILGVAFLVIPDGVIAFMHLPPVPAGTAYVFGMLAARFIAYGIAMFVAAQAPAQHVFLIRNMILIQAIDLGVGLIYTIMGTITLATSGLAMFDAALFMVLLWAWMPKAQ